MYCKIAPSWTYLCLWRVRIIYPCLGYPSARVSENELGSSFETILARFRPNLPEKLNDKNCEKINIKTVITYIPIYIPNISLSQMSVYLENFRLWDQIWSKEWMMTILRNKHWIQKGHLIWRIINFGTKFPKNYFKVES